MDNERNHELLCYKLGWHSQKRTPNIKDKKIFKSNIRPEIWDLDEKTLLKEEIIQGALFSIQWQMNIMPTGEYVEQPFFNILSTFLTFPCVVISLQVCLLTYYIWTEICLVDLYNVCIYMHVHIHMMYLKVVNALIWYYTINEQR